MRRWYWGTVPGRVGRCQFYMQQSKSTYKAPPRSFFYSLDDFFLDEPEPGGGMLIPSYFLLEESYEEIVGRTSGSRHGIRVRFLR